MAFDTGNFLVICGGNPFRPGDFFIHERENNDGKPGKIVTMADGKGDLKEVAKNYIEKGFDPSKIIINGQPATDLFELETKKDEAKPVEDKNISFADRVKIATLLFANRIAGNNSVMQANQQALDDSLRFQEMVNMQNHQNFVDQMNLQNTLQIHHGM